MNFNEIITNIPINGYVIIGCLIIGYLAKQFAPADNRFIPTIVTIVGAVLACVMEQTVTVEICVSGALSGLLSTGMHQLIKQYLRNGKCEESRETEEDKSQE